MKWFPESKNCKLKQEESELVPTAVWIAANYLCDFEFELIEAAPKK
jgi:hypothetical protein